LPKDTLWNYALEAKMLASKLRDQPSQSLAVIAQANAYLRWNNPDSAKALITPELLKYTAKDPATRDIYFALQHLQINCFVGSTDYKDAIAANYVLMREAEKYKDSLVMARCFNSIGIYKYEMGFSREPITLAVKGLSYTSNTPRYNTIRLDLYGNLAEYYYWIVKVDSAYYYAGKTLALATQTGYVNYESWAWQKRSAVYIKTKAYNDAEQAILESIKLDEKVDAKEPHDDNLVTLADVYKLTKQYDKAIQAMTDGLTYYDNPKNVSPHAVHSDSVEGVQRIYFYKTLAMCYKLKGDAKNYEATQERIIKGLDMFYTKNSVQAIADFETKYKVQKKEATIAQQQLALVRENYLFYGSIIIALLGCTIAVLIIREIRRKQKLRLTQLKEEERLLSEKAAADATDTERRRIAADLHDNLGAQLSFIKRNVNFIMDQPAGFSQEDERKYLGSVNDIAQNAMIDLRETIWVLNKDEVYIQEFADKLKSYLRQQLIGKGEIQWRFEEDIKEDWKLSSGEVMHLFRIVQEVISNIIKHAEAGQIVIQFGSDEPGNYRLEIMDDGKGFDVNGKFEGHYGMENIAQRSREISGNLSVTSNAGKGTTIRLHKEKNNAHGLFFPGTTAATFIK
jgi:signal transduction histidine kinase